MIQLVLISFAVFLFVLFFQPFPLELVDFENSLLFVTGFGAITFFLAFFALVLIPLALPRLYKKGEWEDGPPFLLGFIYLTLTSTAFAFYIRYVGNTSLSFYIVFKMVLVCIFSLVGLVLMYKFKSMRKTIDTLQDNNQYYLSKIGEHENPGENQEIEIISDSKSENLKLKSAKILVIRSADNYIEIYYQENEKLEKRLIRNTLKNIESQLASQKQFIRCHRTRIVNTQYINKLLRNYSGYSLKLDKFDETIPVSRQYLLQVKEAIASGSESDSPR